VANVYTEQGTRVTVTAFDSEGRRVGTGSLNLCGACHSAFNLRNLIPGLPATFEGSVMIEPDELTAVMVAWTLNSDRGLLSTLPTGGLGWPISHWDRIWLTYLKVFNAVRTMYPTLDFSNVRLRIVFDPIVNALAFRDGTVQINVALSQLISDSPSELAFAIAHELGHIVQYKTDSAPDEIQADVLAAGFCLAAGYDPYGGAGLFGKLMMASRRTGIIDQLFDNLNDPHTSFSNRIGVLLEALTLACSLPNVQNLCQTYKGIIHPNLPSSLPLSIPGHLAPK
jgi:hypothetical protein